MNEQRVAKIAKALLNGSHGLQSRIQKVARSLIRGDLVRIGREHFDIDDVLRDFEFQDPEGWQRFMAAAERVARVVVMFEDKV